MAKKGMLCTNCGFQGKPKTIIKGSWAIELVLWLLFLLPGLIYTMWRSRSAFKGCPECKEKMLSLDSPVAQKFLKELA